MDIGKLFSFSIFLRVNSQSCMRNSTKSLFRNQFTGLPTNPVCFIFYAYKRSLQVLNKLHLPLRQLSCLFFGESASTFFQHLKCRRCIGNIVAIGIHNRGFQQIIITICFFELFINNLPKFFKFSIGITCFFTHNYCYLKFHIQLFKEPTTNGNCSISGQI